MLVVPVSVPNSTGYLMPFSRSRIKLFTDGIVFLVVVLQLVSAQLTPSTCAAPTLKAKVQELNRACPQVRVVASTGRD